MTSVRSVGNVDLSIGLITCPVKMVGTFDNHDRKGSMYHYHPGDDSYGKVRMPKLCEDCGATVPPGEISKGYEENGDMVILTPSELETVAANTGTSIDIPQFVAADSVDPMMFADQNIYRLFPDPKRGRQAARSYVMIRSALTESNLVGVVQYTRWGRNRLGLLDVEDNTGMLLIRNMLWPDELRVPDTSDIDAVSEEDLDPRLLPVMHTLVKSMTGEWEPSTYHDLYTEQLSAAIETKASGGEVAKVVGSDIGKGIDDVSELLAKLEASVAAKAAAKKAPAKTSRKRGAA